MMYLGVFVSIAAKESTMENDVGTVKKSRAASPAPKTSKAKEDKEVVKPSPSAEKVSKVEKSSETKTDKERANLGCWWRFFVFLPIDSSRSQELTHIDTY